VLEGRHGTEVVHCTLGVVRACRTGPRLIEVLVWITHVPGRCAGVGQPEVSADGVRLGG
jgi:hypothetical protein